MQGPLHARPMPQEAKACAIRNTHQNRSFANLFQAFVVAHPGPNATPLQHEWQAGLSFRTKFLFCL